MKNYKIRFCGAVYDNSGYAEFSRYFVYAFHKAGLNVSVEPILIDSKKYTDFGEKGEICKIRQVRERNPDINIVNMVPLFFEKFYVKGAINIGFTMWEASHLPSIWVDQCNAMDAIFVPCSWNKEIFEKSGVTVPVFVVSPGFDPTTMPINPSNINKQKDKYTFYSIFQWSERKNPEGLLRAYFHAFNESDKVRLVLKTYKQGKLPNNQQIITQEIERIKRETNLKSYPEINLICDALTSNQMSELHDGSSCFVLPHSSEGWGMPHFEAMSYGNPVIATGFSGNMDFMSNDNSYLLDYQMTPVKNMQWFVPWLDGKMSWASPDLIQLSETMRYIYNNQDLAKQKGELGRQFIVNNFGTNKPTDMFIEAITKLNG